MADLTGTNIRGYEIQSKVGQGGFGSVYRAFQAIVKREVAIKVIAPHFANEPKFIRRFDLEAQLVGRLEHPFIVPLFDYWREPTGAYLVMRYYPAGSLKDYLDHEKKLDLPQTVKMLEQIGSALDTAHRNQIAHLDLKPANILLDDDHNAYLTDFGVARFLQEATSENGEDDNIIITPLYSPPEMLQSSDDLTIQADIYSLGFIAYRMLTGFHPYRSDKEVTDTPHLLQAHLQKPVPLIEDIPLEVNQAIQIATQKRAESRFDNIQEMLDLFRRALNPHAVEIDSNRADENAPIENPYKGLHPFEEGDAHNFHGRENLIAELIDHLASSDFLAVVGPSGSGKSSVVRAGLIPRLRNGAIEGSENWFFTDMVPGDAPIKHLVDALLQVAVNHLDDLEDRLQHHSDQLSWTLDQILPDEQHPVILVIDQFEEVFTRMENEQERQQFLELLHKMSQLAHSRLKIVITLRADFYDRPLMYEHFGALLQTNTEVVLRLTGTEIEEAVLNPAKNANLEVESDLLVAIIDDLSGEIGALPLLQYTLTEVFEHRHGRILTLEAYQQIGGILGSLTRRADELFTSLSDENRTVAQQIFLRLVTLGEGIEDTRRRVPRSELAAIIPEDTLDAILGTFGQHRLLTFDLDPQTREPTIEVAHEALIQRWGRFRHWLTSNREDLRLQRNLKQAVKEWQSANEDTSYLLRGSHLAQYDSWKDSTKLTLSEEEKAYLEASHQEYNREMQEHLEQQRREAELIRRSRNRLRWFLVASVLATIFTLALSVYALNQSRIAHENEEEALRQANIAHENEQEAIRQAEIALENEQEAFSLALAAKASSTFDGGFQSLALKLATIAVDYTDNPPAEVIDALELIAFSPGERRIWQAYEQDIASSVAFSPDGNYILTGAGLGGSGRPPPPDDGNAPSGNPTLPEGGDDPENRPPPPRPLERPYELIIWDTETGAEIIAYDFHQAAIDDILFISETDVVSADASGTVIIWQMETGEIMTRFQTNARGRISLSYSPEKNLLLAFQFDNRLEVSQHTLFDLSSGEQFVRTAPQADIEGNLVRSVMMPDGVHVISGYNDTWLQVWNVENLTEPVAALKLPVDSLDLGGFHIIVSANGERVVISTGFEVLTWELSFAAEQGEVLSHEIEEHLRLVPLSVSRPWRIALDATGTELFVASLANDLAFWSFTESTELGSIFAEYREIRALGFSADGSQILLSSSDGIIKLWDTFDTALDIVQVLEGYPQTRGAVFIASGDAPQSLRVASFGGTNFRGRLINPEVVLYNAFTGTEIFSYDDLSGLSYFPSQLVVSSDYRYLMATTKYTAPAIVTNNTIRNWVKVWDAQTGELISEIEPEENIEFGAIAFNPVSGQNGEPYQAVMNWGSEIRLFNPLTGEFDKTLGEHGEMITILQFSPDGKTVYSAGNDGMLRVWDVESSTERQEIPTPNDRFDMMEVDPTNTYLIINHPDATIAFYNIETGTVEKRFTGHDVGVNSVSLNHDGSHMVSGSPDNSYILWDVETGEILRRYFYNSAIFATDFSPDGELYLAGSAQDGIEIWETNLIPLPEIQSWIAENRHIRELAPGECVEFRLQDYCTEIGIIQTN